MSQSLLLKVRGLYTSYNSLGTTIPDGALEVADNMVIDKTDTGESRRGLAQLQYSLPFTTSRADKLYEYQNTLLTHYDANNLAYYNTSTGFQTYSATGVPSPYQTLAFTSITASNQITITGHGYTTGIPVQLTTTGYLPTGLSAGTTYYVVVLNANTISLATTYANATASSPTVISFSANYAFTVSSANATVGATYTNNGVTFTVLTTIVSQTSLSCSAAGFPATSGTLTKTAGTGDSSITFSACTPSGVCTVVPQGAFRHPDPLLAKMRAAQANKNLYMTSNAGILKLDALTNNWKPAGMYQALDCTASILSAGTFTAANSTDTNATITANGYVNGLAGTLGASGAFTNVNVSSNIITITNHGYVTGEPITLDSGGQTITGLGSGTFYVSVVGVSTFKLYDTNAHALAGGSTGLQTLGTTSGSGHVLPSVVYIISVDANTVQFATTYANAIAGTPMNFAGIVSGGGTTASSFVPSLVGIGFLGAAQVGYRVVWGYTDANQNLILGAPSYQTVVTNNTGSNQAVSLQITIPSGITTADFYQVYRSSQSSSTTVTPFDDGQLVYESSPTSAQITALSITIVDQTPDSLKGAALYTNASQEGILYANTPPPYAKDIATFYSCLFFANTQTIQQLNLSILSVGGQYGIQVGDVITIGGNAFTAISSTPTTGSNNFQIITAGTPAANINATAINLVRTINQSTSNTTVYAFYTSSAAGLPGQIMFQARTLGTAAFTITYTDAAGSTAGASAFSPALPPSGSTVISSNQQNLNGLMYSQQQQPDAVPIVNILYPGSASSPILRIIPLRFSMFIFKTDGIYRVTGNSPATFTIDLVDNTAILQAPDSAVPLNNGIYAMTSQGVVNVTDSGVRIMSKPIEDLIIPLFALPSDVTLGSTTTNATNAYSFGVAYESDRKYILWTVTEDGDTYANQAFVYNYLTDAWTRWTRNQTFGLVLSADDKLYAGDPLSNNVDQERKSGTYTDYADEAYSNVIESVSNTYTLALNNLQDVDVGDLVYFYNTTNGAIASAIATVNPLYDTVVVNDVVTWPLINGFSSSNVSSASGNLQFNIANHGYFAGTALTFTTTGSLPTGVTAGVTYYVLYVNANAFQLSTTSGGTAIAYSSAGTGNSDSVPTIYILKAIPCVVQWVPQSGNMNPGILKQFSEATVLLNESYFDTANLNFFSDVDGSLESVPVSGAGQLGWGLFGWGNSPWGGVSLPVPQRTYVPRNKQKCDLLSVQFQVTQGWAQFRLTGLSLIWREISSRVSSW